MRKTITGLLFALSATACVHNGDMPTVRAGNDPVSANERARAGGHAAAGGGSHSPGSETFSGVGSSR
jgi:hypothetical protein